MAAAATSPSLASSSSSSAVNDLDNNTNPTKKRGFAEVERGAAGGRRAEKTTGNARGND
jgi:hypothetical protein